MKINTCSFRFVKTPFCLLKVHIKYEKRKNVAITLSIKDLKGLLEVV